MPPPQSQSCVALPTQGVVTNGHVQGPAGVLQTSAGLPGG